MTTAGSLALNFSLASALLAMVASFLYIRRNSEIWLLLARQAVRLHFILIATSTGILLLLLSKDDFSVVYVTDHVNSALPLFYKLTSVWAGQAGSMLWWNFLLTLFTVISVRQIARINLSYVPWMIIFLAGSSLFFSALSNFSAESDPFRVFRSGDQLVAQPDGRGLNPLLQHWAMVIHPPILYLGYVSFAIPYSIAMAALASRNVNIEWTRMIRRWTLFSWFFLGTGILLGGKWAYEELGWGGYWAWDPVENASLMPWLSGTAFLHSVIVQEKRGMLKVWNMVLVSISFFMCIFGTFLTRSGVVSSVHAFAKSTLGPFFVGFMILIILVSLYLIITRLPLLKSDRPFDSFLSREAGFLFNNVVLLLALFTVIFGTMYPVFTETFLNRRLSFSQVWFDKWMMPLGLIVLFLTGAGPLLAWRRTDGSTLLKNFRIPGAVLISAFLILQFLMKTGWKPALTMALSAFVLAGVAEELIRVASNRRNYTGENFLLALVLSVFQNKRRYLGYLVHAGIALLFIGFSGKAFTKEARLSLSPKEAESIHGYTFEVAAFDNLTYPEDAGKAVPLYITQKLTMKVYRDNRLLGEDTTEVRNYPMFNVSTASYDDSQTTSEPAIIQDGLTDVYIQYGGPEEGGRRLVIQVWINPLVRIVWLGFGLMTFFGLVLLLPVGENRVFRLGRLEISIQPRPASP